ncbi:hypothetical protein ABID21_004293 [Pseudorhizobium tarimense]|uniref:Uncharacterized protein n=1 Tax=Pseudorhizobium tarimense TaxID=1079109 RepID=A0ABV2HC83_9HYPH
MDLWTEDRNLAICSQRSWSLTCLATEHALEITHAFFQVANLGGGDEIVVSLNGGVIALKPARL